MILLWPSRNTCIILCRVLKNERSSPRIIYLRVWRLRNMANHVKRPSKNRKITKLPFLAKGSFYPKRKIVMIWCTNVPCLKRQGIFSEKGNLVIFSFWGWDRHKVLLVSRNFRLHFLTSILVNPHVNLSLGEANLHQFLSQTSKGLKRVLLS